MSLPEGDEPPAFYERMFEREGGKRMKPLFAKLMREKASVDGDKDGVWFHFNESGKLEQPEWLEAFARLSDDDLYRLWGFLSNATGGSRKNSWEPGILERLTPDVPSVNCYLIPAIRRVGAKGSLAEDFSGEGIIDRLAQIQNPSALEQDRKRQFDGIVKFLRTVTDNPTASIEIPYDRDTILVHLDGKTLPLDSLGSGIHEVVILAAASTILEQSVVLMEEPELHLNPILQKKLVRYLATDTSNQYFITTHSAALMDTPGAEVYHIELKDGCSLVERVTSDGHRSKVCEDLGYHPSDLLQSNCIIWVEGPSDRIFLNWWLGELAPSLIEGIHYSIMFYGGRLLSHLSNEDLERVEDFISLRRLNRRGAILIDSDKKTSRASINDTKARLREEFDAGPGHAWITEGREIENYIDTGVLTAAITAIHPGARSCATFGRYESVLTLETNKGMRMRPDKVKLAQYIVQNFHPDFSRYGLEVSIRKLIKFVEESNPGVSAQ